MINVCFKSKLDCFANNKTNLISIADANIPVEFLSKILTDYLENKCLGSGFSRYLVGNDMILIERIFCMSELKMSQREVNVFLDSHQGIYVRLFDNSLYLRFIIMDKEFRRPMAGNKKYFHSNSSVHNDFLEKEVQFESFIISSDFDVNDKKEMLNLYTDIIDTIFNYCFIKKSSGIISTFNSEIEKYVMNVNMLCSVQSSIFLMDYIGLIVGRLDYLFDLKYEDSNMLGEIFDICDDDIYSVEVKINDKTKVNCFVSNFKYFKKAFEIIYNYAITKYVGSKEQEDAYMLAIVDLYNVYNEAIISTVTEVAESRKSDDNKLEENNETEGSE